MGIALEVRNATRAELLRLIGNVLDVKCVLRGTSQSKRLAMIGKDISKLYEEATHRRSVAVSAPSVMSGRPCLLLQYEIDEIAELPMSIDFQRPQEGLAFSKLTHRGLDLNTWYVSLQVQTPGC